MEGVSGKQHLGTFKKCLARNNERIMIVWTALMKNMPQLPLEDQHT